MDKFLNEGKLNSRAKTEPCWNQSASDGPTTAQLIICAPYALGYTRATMVKTKGC